MTERVHLYPRRKSGADADAVPFAKGRQPVELTRSVISAMFGMPQPYAARDLGISLTALKQVCRKLGIVRWPYMRSSKVFRKEGGRSSRLGRAVACALDINPPARDDTDAQAQGPPAASPAAAYHSDFDGSSASCYSAETELARASSAGSDFSDGFYDDIAVHGASSPEAPARGNSQTDMADDSDVGDDLGWLVGSGAEILGASSEAALERAWRCLERCCQARQAAAAGDERAAQPTCEWVPAPDCCDVM
jgi:hypothetical protein